MMPIHDNVEGGGDYYFIFNNGTKRCFSKSRGRERDKLAPLSYYSDNTKTGYFINRGRGTSSPLAPVGILSGRLVRWLSIKVYNSSQKVYRPSSNLPAFLQ